MRCPPTQPAKPLCHHVPSTNPVRTITCPHFRAIPGSKRCADYIPNGSCSRPDEFMCVEWLKLNPAPTNAVALPDAARSLPIAPAEPVARDLFGTAVTRPAPKPRATASPTSAVSALPKTNKQLLLTETPVVRAVTEADVASFKAEGFELCLETESLGPIWIVTEYTEEDRTELKIEHAMVLATIGSVFPGARVTQLKRPPERPREKSTGP